MYIIYIYELRNQTYLIYKYARILMNENLQQKRDLLNRNPMNIINVLPVVLR